MNTPTRDFLQRPDTDRRRSVRRALAVIPNTTPVALSPGDAPTVIEGNAMDNIFNSRHAADSWSPAPSPDEMVIQKRGRRRRTIIWSPDLDACKRDSLFGLSSRDRTPVKSPNKTTTMSLRGTPRKRLLLGDTNDNVSLTTPERNTKFPSDTPKSTTQRQFQGNLVNGLRGLSHEQLVKMIVDLVTMQEDGMLAGDEKIRDVLLKKMPIADIQPLREKLCGLRQNVYASLVSSNVDESGYGRAYVHLNAFQKALVEQGTKLLESQHWPAVMQYVFAAWSITKELPEWENPGIDSVTRKCYKHLAQFCTQALKSGSFVLSTLEAYDKKLQSMMTDCEDLGVCLELVKQAKRDV